MMKTAKGFVCVMLILTICLGLTACGGAALPMIPASDIAQTAAAGETGKDAAETKEAAETNAPATEQPPAPEPKLLEVVTMQRGTVTSWITNTYEGDLLVRKYDSYQGIETVYSYSEDGKTVITKDRAGNVTNESRYNSQEKLIFIKSTDSEYISLKDNQGREVYHYVKSGGGEHELSYDEQGRVSEIFSHNSFGDGYLNFEYSPDGLHLDIISNVNGSTSLYTEVDYDSAGHIVKETDRSTRDPFVTTWTYDERGRLTGEEQYQGDTFKVRYTWTHDENGQNDSRIDEYASYTTTHYYLRDERGEFLQIYEEQEDPTNNAIVYTILESRYVYNDRGDLAKRYNYTSSAETWEDWNTVVFYFYEGDQIPQNIGQLIP